MKKLLTGLFIIFYFIAKCQIQQLSKNSFMSNDLQQAFDYWIISKPNTNFHSSFKPYLSQTYVNATDSTIPFKFYGFDNYYFNFPKKHINLPPASFQLIPILEEEFAFDLLTQKPIFTVLGGTHLKVNVHSNLTLALTVLGGNKNLPFFSDTNFQTQKVFSEFGQAYGNNKNGYSFADFTGYLSYTPRHYKFFNFQVGRDKHFIGDGYRSVLLSDYSPAYPYFRINTNLWRFQYNVWYTLMNDISKANGVKDNFTNKFGAFHYLSYNVTKKINIAFFENVVWRGSDSNQVRNFELNYLNPVIFFRPQEYSIGSPDNSFIGININATLFNKIKLYGQLGLDEFYLKEIIAQNGWWANKQAWQLGVKYINAFKIKGLKIQAEYNEARPYTYSHGLVEQNYAHYGKPLAHPLGANFKELLGFINYRKNKWELSWQGMYAIVGKDSANNKSNIGQNIFLSYTSRSSQYGNYTTQGIETKIMQSQLKLTYFIIPELNLRIEIGYIQRSEKNVLGYELQNPFLFFGFKTSFWNSYLGD